MKNFTHIDENGNAVMVDVGAKDITRRKAAATGTIKMSPECFAAVEVGAVKKGDVLTVAQVAGIQGAKNASALIPLCHPLSLTHAAIVFTPSPKNCEIDAVCTVECEGRTGVEMEALCGVAAALLTVYDMCKAIDRQMVISNIRLLKKSGGKSGDFSRDEDVAQYE